MEIKMRKFQAGGPAAPAQDQKAPAGGAESAQAPQGGEQGQDPLMQIAQAASQALQNQDCDTAFAVCQAFIQLIQQSGGGEQQQAAPEGEPVYRAGGKLVKRV